jgi:plastocyanin
MPDNRIKITLLLLAMTLSAGMTRAGDNPAMEVEIFKFQFQPQEISVKAGDTVRWTNKEKRQYHSVWFEQIGEPEPSYIFPGETYQRTFDTAGTYPYRCGPHKEMTGIVRVE